MNYHLLLCLCESCDLDAHTAVEGRKVDEKWPFRCWRKYRPQFICHLQFHVAVSKVWCLGRESNLSRSTRKERSNSENLRQDKEYGIEKWANSEGEYMKMLVNALGRRLFCYDTICNGSLYFIFPSLQSFCLDQWKESGHHLIWDMTSSPVNMRIWFSLGFRMSAYGSILLSTLLA